MNGIKDESFCGPLLNKRVHHFATKIPLLPRVNSVAVCTQKPKVSLVFLPVSKSPTPTVFPLLGLQLRARVDVVYIENPDVIIAACDAGTTKLCDDLQLSYPITLGLMRPVAVFIPKRDPACVGAEPVVALCFADLTKASFAPTVRQVALSGAVLASTVFESVCVNKHACRATFTNRFLRSPFHDFIVPQEPKYFEIAKKRIRDELDKTRLIEKPKKLVQRSLIGE